MAKRTRFDPLAYTVLVDIDPSPLKPELEDAVRSYQRATPAPSAIIAPEGAGHVPMQCAAATARVLAFPSDPAALRPSP